VPEQFIIYPAMTFAHKNHLRLFQAMALLRDRQGLRVNLVMSGRRYRPFWPTLEAEIERLRLADQVTVLGGVSEALLEALFTSARFMVFPSLFEGLGLPILEAFQQGLPVLAAAETCIPEVAGDAAILFDGKDVESIAGAIAQAVESPEALAALVQAGYRRLSDFNWDKAGPTFVACYKDALDAPMTDLERQLFNHATA
jgi:glycosyltransferase involved in cell wall biosynthesis